MNQEQESAQQDDDLTPNDSSVHYTNDSLLGLVSANGLADLDILHMSKLLSAICAFAPERIYNFHGQFVARTRNWLPPQEISTNLEGIS
jgi:hypothetical protein